MRKKILLLIFLSFFLFQNRAAAIELNNIKKLFSIISVEYKNYNIYVDESISLFGAKLKSFVNSNFYWGPAGFAAISGKRAGYLEGGLILGYQFGDKIVFGAELFSGAGGGGSAPQGGGLIINPNCSLNYYFSNDLSIGANIGYIQFLNGKIASLTLGFNIGLNIWNVVYEK
ncbi:MAG: hypothetical protein WC860_00900 [Candidatus Margulisiibacteriota bacterium]|jgi:hypothetical protein